MNIKLFGSILLSSLFFISPVSFAGQTLSTQGQAANGCQSSCAGIPKGQCSCVTTDGIKCCGKRQTA